MKMPRIETLSMPYRHAVALVGAITVILLGATAFLVLREGRTVRIEPTLDIPAAHGVRVAIPWNQMPYDPALGPRVPPILFNGQRIAAPSSKPAVPAAFASLAAARTAGPRGAGGGAGDRAARLFASGSAARPAYESGVRVVERRSLDRKLEARAVPPELADQNYIPSTVNHLVVLRDVNGYTEAIWRAGPDSAGAPSGLCLSAIEQALPLVTTPQWLGEACGVEAVREIRRRPVPAAVSDRPIAVSHPSGGG